jgi:hypothetical protein
VVLWRVPQSHHHHNPRRSRELSCHTSDPSGVAHVSGRSATRTVPTTPTLNGCSHMSRTNLQGQCRRHVKTHSHPHNAETGIHSPKTQKEKEPHDITSVLPGAGQSLPVRMVIPRSSRLSYSLRIKSQDVVKQRKRGSFRSWWNSAGSLNALGARYLEERKQR